MVIVWVLTNQYRLFLFLILSGAYLPPKVVEHIKGGEVFSFNFSFLSIQKFSGIESVVEELDFPQTDSILETIGLESGSAVVSNLNLAVSVLLIVVAHLGFRIIEKVMLRKLLLLMSSDWIKKKVTQLINGLEFGVYIRMFIESNMLVVASLVADINRLDFSSTQKILSFTFSILMFTLVIICWVLTMLFWYQTRKKQLTEIDQHSKLSELFTGVKPKL